MLSDAHFTECTLPKLVAQPVEVLSCHHGLAKFLKLVHDHGDDILLILQKRISPLSCVHLRRIIFVTARLSDLCVGVGFTDCVLFLYLSLDFTVQ